MDNLRVEKLLIKSDNSGCYTPGSAFETEWKICMGQMIKKQMFPTFGEAHRHKMWTCYENRCLTCLLACLTVHPCTCQESGWRGSCAFNSTYDVHSDGRDWDHANRAELTTGEDRPGQETLERCCAWPMLQEEPE